MLRSLYATDNTARVGIATTDETSKIPSIDNQVNEDVWHLIDVFLTNRGDLTTSRDKAVKSQSVYKYAELILNEGLAASNSNGIQCGGQSSPEPSTPVVRTGKLSPARSIGISTPADMSMGRQDQQQDHLQQNQNVDSWTLITKLLGRKNIATQKDSALVAEPYQPLIAALTSKLKELRIIYRGLFDQKSFVDGDDSKLRDMLLLPSNNGGEGDQSSGGINGGGPAQSSLEEEDLVAKLECKLHLWSLLFSSVCGVVGGDCS